MDFLINRYHPNFAGCVDQQGLQTLFASLSSEFIYFFSSSVFIKSLNQIFSAFRNEKYGYLLIPRQITAATSVLFLIASFALESMLHVLIQRENVAHCKPISGEIKVRRNPNLFYEVKEGLQCIDRQKRIDSSNFLSKSFRSYNPHDLIFICTMLYRILT